MLRQDARNVNANADFLRIWTDQEANNGVIISSKRVKMASSSASLQEGMNGVQRNKKISGFPWNLALRRGSIKGALLNFLHIAFIVLMRMPSIFGSICW